MTLTLAVDCGGTGIKSSVLDDLGRMTVDQVLVPTPYPLPPDRFISIIAGIADELPRADRVTVGMPGMIRHGRVVSTPHYVTESGPHTTPVPDLVAAWRGFDARAGLSGALRLPTIVLNDAEVAGAGAVTGTGFEVMFTLGTGLGCAIFDDGHLLPHLEVSRAPVRRGLIYDTYIGDASRKQIGDEAWSRRVRDALSDLRPMFEWDRLYLGGGNSSRLGQKDLMGIGGSIRVVPNSTGIIGGVKAWKLHVDQLRQPMGSSGSAEPGPGRSPGPEDAGSHPGRST